MVAAREHRPDDLLELGGRPLEIVVDDEVVELLRELQLLVRERQPLADLAGAFGRAVAQPPLELVEARRRDEDRDAAGNLVADAEGAHGLEVEQRDPAARRDAVELRAERPRALAPREVDVLDELA